MPKIVRFHQTGGADVLQLDELPTPVPQQGEVRIRVEAIGLNRAEVMFRQGAYLEQPQLPSLIGYEASGIVEEVGPGVTDLKPGDRVSSIPSFSMTQYGTYGEVAVLPAYSLAKYPSRLNSVEATAIWMQYLTAYGLVEFGHLHEGDQVLIMAASSSVGLAAIQIANALGAKSIATTRNPTKEKALRDAGAHQVVNTGSDKWIEHVREITVGKGVDLAFDPVAGPGLEQIAQVVREEGTIFEYGALASEPTPFPLFAAIGKNLTIRGYTLFSIVKKPDRLERAKRWVYRSVVSRETAPCHRSNFSIERHR